MANILEIPSTELNKYIFGVPESSDEADKGKYSRWNSEYYHEGGSHMLRARNEHSRNMGSPNYTPVPFALPSRKYADQWWRRYNEYYIKDGIPEYIVKNILHLGTSKDFDGGKLNLRGFDRSIIFWNKTIFEGGVRIECLSTDNSIEFTDCELKTLTIDFCKIKKLRITNCNIHELTIHESCIENLEIINCKNVKLIVKINIVQDYHFQYSDDFEHKIENILIKETTIDRLELLGDNISILKFEESTCASSLIQLKTSHLFINNESTNRIKLNEISLDWIGNESEKISKIENFDIDSLKISGHIKENTLILTNNNVRQLSLENFVNEGQFRIIDLLLENHGEVYFKSVQFGEADFTSVDFWEADKFQIISTNLNDITTHDVRFPLNIITRSVSDYEGIRAIYRQLKNIAGRQSDRVNELRNEAAEMRLLTKILKEKGSSDYYLLLLNDFTSSHGQDWLKATLILLAVAIVMYTAANFFAGYRYFDIYSLPNNVASFLNFLNPVHRYEWVFETDGNSPRWSLGLAKFTDVLFRFIGSYLIFQIIRASRKFFR